LRAIEDAGADAQTDRAGDGSATQYPISREKSNPSGLINRQPTTIVAQGRDHYHEHEGEGKEQAEPEQDSRQPRATRALGH
jgi:hypothetical protein